MTVPTSKHIHLGFNSLRASSAPYTLKHSLHFLLGTHPFSLISLLKSTIFSKVPIKVPVWGPGSEALWWYPRVGKSILRTILAWG